jgi:hypothetical protein
MSFFDSGVEDPSNYLLLPTSADYQFMDINNFVDLLGLHGYVGTNLDSSIMSMRSWCVAAMPIPQEWSAIENMKVNITSGVSYQFMDMTATPPALEGFKSELMNMTIGEDGTSLKPEEKATIDYQFIADLSYKADTMGPFIDQKVELLYAVSSDFEEDDYLLIKMQFDIS